MTTLHYAIKLGDIHAVNLLIANGADVNSRDASGVWNFTALTRAIVYNQLETAKLLIDLGANVRLSIAMIHYENETKFDALYYAAQKGNAPLVNLLLENGADLDVNYGPNYGSPLHIASKAGNYEAVVALVTAGAKINMSVDPSRSSSNWVHGTPLNHAAYNLTYKENPKNLDLIKFLVEHGGIRTCMNEIRGCPVINGYLQSQGR
jgi:ankyrin repeat protein